MCFVTVPHPLGMISKEEVNAKVDAAFDDIVKAATAWTPSKEKQDAQVKPYPAKRFKFSGTYADVNDMFQKRKWSLSLPIVPPTVDKVAAMLKGTKRNPAEVLWVVPPRQGMLTVELVAALGVYFSISSCKCCPVAVGSSARAASRYFCLSVARSSRSS